MPIFDPTNQTIHQNTTTMYLTAEQNQIAMAEDAELLKEFISLPDEISYNRAKINEYVNNGNRYMEDQYRVALKASISRYNFLKQKFQRVFNETI
jgi:dGTP triphosphohydrolase